MINSIVINLPLIYKITARLLCLFIILASINSLSHFESLPFLESAQYLTAYGTAQPDALALISSGSDVYGYQLSVIFIGVHGLFLGLLIFRSSYFPEILGVLLVIASFSYLTNSFIGIHDPAYVTVITPDILLPAIVVEVSLLLWLIAGRGKWQMAFVSGGER